MDSDQENVQVGGPKRGVVFKFPEPVKHRFQFLVQSKGLFVGGCCGLLVGKITKSFVERMELIVQIVQSG